jgi:MYXO-CTERM domain-containing protein
MTIDRTTGLISWTPTAVGAVEVTVRASNGLAPDAEQSFAVSVKADEGPRAILRRPVEGERVSGSMAEFFGDCVDDVGCTHAEFYVDGELRFTDTRTDNPFYFGGEPNRWDTTGLAPGEHLVRFVVVDSAGMRAQAEVKVCVGDGSCELPRPPSSGEVGGCGCGAAPVAPLAWLALGALALRRRRAREE